MRPRTLDELVGQEQLRAPGSPLRQLVEGDQSMSLLLWGPPGTGKTTIASILSQQTDRRFVEVSAVSAGVKEVRAAIDAARAELVATGHETVLFVDEVHRFSKAQQDALLPGRREPLGHPGRRDHREPVLLGDLPAALAQPAAAAGVADRRRRPRGPGPRARRRARPGRRLRRRGRGPRPPGPAGRRRRAPLADLPRGRRRRGRRPRARHASTSRPPRPRSTRPRCATTARATSTTT